MIGRQGGPGGNVGGRDLDWRRTITRTAHRMPARRAVRSVGESEKDMQVSGGRGQNAEGFSVESETGVGELVSLMRLI